MKKLFILAACLVASSVFAVPQIEYKNSKFIVNEAGYVDFTLSYSSTATSGKNIFKDIPASWLNNYGFVVYWDEPNPGFLNMTYGTRMHFDAGESFGAWATVSLYDPSHIFYTYTLHLIVSEGYLQISQYDDISNGLRNVVTTDTSITGESRFTNAYEYSYYWEDWDQGGTMWEYETVIATFTFNWTPDGIPAPSGQPLPGIIPALLLGAGVYAARRKKKMAA